MFTHKCGLWSPYARGRTTGYFIEVGAYDGVSLSNTFLLEHLGWCGLLVEPILPLCKEAARSRPRSRVIQAACGKRGSRGTARFTVAQNVPVLSFLHADQEHVDRCKREGARGYRRFYRQEITDFYLRAEDPADDLTLAGFVAPDHDTGRIMSR